jgi:hypothetical protein
MWEWHIKSITRGQPSHPAVNVQHEAVVADEQDVIGIRYLRVKNEISDGMGGR